MIAQCNGIEVRSRQGREYLKQIANGEVACRMRTDAAHDWRITFSFRDGTEVFTDSFVSLVGDSEPRVECVLLHEWESPLVAKFLLEDGWSFEVRHAKSPHDSQLGVIQFRASCLGRRPFASTSLGHDTVVRDGRVVVYGSAWAA